MARGTRRRAIQSTPGVRMYAKMNASRKGVRIGASAMMAANRPAATAIQSRTRLVSSFSRGAFIKWGHGAEPAKLEAGRCIR